MSDIDLSEVQSQCLSGDEVDRVGRGTPSREGGADWTDSDADEEMDVISSMVKAPPSKPWRRCERREEDGSSDPDADEEMDVIPSMVKAPPSKPWRMCDRREEDGRPDPDADEEVEVISPMVRAPPSKPWRRGERRGQDGRSEDDPRPRHSVWSQKQATPIDNGIQSKSVVENGSGGSSSSEPEPKPVLLKTVHVLRRSERLRQIKTKVAPIIGKRAMDKRNVQLKRKRGPAGELDKS